jgi:hypothetical protein
VALRRLVGHELGVPTTTASVFQDESLRPAHDPGGRQARAQGVVSQQALMGQMRS